ncbi:MAG: DMT family transporter [Chromatiaceae bacterium]|jgi:drug/metabolite transporter (DMT)-like permease|nr:DMT family transporter [Chromatiaceae bacterium]
MSRPVSPYLLVTLAPLFWSGNFVLGRALGDTIPPIALSFWRWALALLIVLPFTLPSVLAQAGLIRRHLVVLVLLGFLGVANFNTFVYLGLQSTTATNAVLLQSTTPVLIVGLSFVLLGERISSRQAAGILVSLAGVGAIVLEGDAARLADLSLNRGDLWVLAAVLTWALYSVCLRWRPVQIEPLVLLTTTIAAGVVLLLPIYLWDLSRGGGFAVNETSLGAITYVALFPSVLAYVFWNRAVAELGANRTGQFLHLMPVFGTLLAMVLLGERMRGYHLVGIALIGAGIWLAAVRGRRALGG